MAYIEKKKYYKTLFFSLFAVMVCLVILSSTLGAANISFMEAMKIMLSRIPILNNFVSTEAIKSTYFLIVLKLRLPRILLSVLVGAGLSIVGASYQGVFKNPMASPSVLGISTGAAFGATITIVMGLRSVVFGFGFITVAAFIGAIATTFIVYRIAKTGKRIPTVTLLLAGIAMTYLLSSIIHIMIIFNRTNIEEIVLWMMGSVNGASWNQVGGLLPVVLIGTVTITIFSKDLNIMATGDETASSLGVEVENVKKVLLIISSIIIAACVSVSGIIGFVGLIIPHIIRLILGSDHRVVIPFSALGGAVFLLICDTLARNLMPYIFNQPSEIPVGAITSLFGAPFFVYLLIKNKRKVFL